MLHCVVIGATIDTVACIDKVRSMILHRDSGIGYTAHNLLPLVSKSFTERRMVCLESWGVKYDHAIPYGPLKLF
ncbi:hypothetical protein HYALB_00014065 [Hymenoscyphus albidus]|uniref:Uncharacterized protein n=1 Tax=Hymenoscyphus albidus TaxID=595503 RepID=A0A9N9Q1G3_9HELO|nr:hypothetical protein HYALB_00014065 [Hymenoscyphus albidus]